MIEDTLFGNDHDEDSGRFGVERLQTLACPKHPEKHTTFHADIRIHARVRHHRYGETCLDAHTSLEEDVAHLDGPVECWYCSECGAVAMGYSATGTHDWEYLGRPGGYDYLRYFRDRESGRVAAVDNSGNCPDDAEGESHPLWIDRTRPIRMGARTTEVFGGCTLATLPFCDDDGEPAGSTTVPHADIAWLLRHGFIDRSQIVLPDDLNEVMAALGVAP